MTRFPITPVVLAAPLLATTTALQAQAPNEEPPPNRGFLANHWEAIAIGTSLVAAGFGSGILLWKRRYPAPNDGITRTWAQRKALAEALRYEKKLTTPDVKVRHESILRLLDLLLRLRPEDQPERIQRIAAQLCLDWPAVDKDRQYGDEIKNRLPHLFHPLLHRLAGQLIMRTDEWAADHVRDNAVAILRLIRRK